MQHSKKTYSFSMKLLAFLAVIVLISATWSNYYGSIIYSEMYGFSKALQVIWFPSIPNAVYWLLICILGWKNWRTILFGLTFLIPNDLISSFDYIYHYHHNMGSLYYPGQILSLASFIAMILGLILLILYCNYSLSHPGKCRQAFIRDPINDDYNRSRIFSNCTLASSSTIAKFRDDVEGCK